MLYERDYRILSQEEMQKLDAAKRYLHKRFEVSVTRFNKYHKMRPEASCYFESLFPNHFLHTGHLQDHAYLKEISNGFSQILEGQPTEQAILNYVSSNRYYPLVGTILKSQYYFGHHGAYLFKEFPLPPNYVTDYLLVGKNSGGYEFVFVEFESPIGQIVNKDGTLGNVIRKGLKQIEDWDTWIDANFAHLKLLFQRYLGTSISLPDEFISLDKTRIHYALVAGRRCNFTDRTYRIRRKLKKERNITLLHYDNLLDELEVFKSSANY